MFKDTKEKKYCNCSFSPNIDILKKNLTQSFCNNCGSILLKAPDSINIYYTLKSKQKIKKAEFNPIDIIKNMKKITEKEFPYINEEFNINDEEKLNKENVLNSIKLYLKHRKMIILTLQKMMKMFDFTDLIFYQCLFYADTILSHIITEDFTEKIIIYYIIGYFLCSAKSKETDIYEPSLDSFCYIKKRDHLPINKIAYYEVLCLKSIKYNIFGYSAYDWISELSTNGLVFNCEINKNNSILLINGHRHSMINIINKSALKMLLSITIKKIFIKYSPMHIAFSLIQLAREKYLDKSLIRPDLFNNLINLYGIKFNDYKKCYEEIKEEINENPRDNSNLEIPKIEESEEINKKGENSNKGKIKALYTEEDLPPLNNDYKIHKVASLEKKMKTTQILPNLSEIAKNLKNEEEKTDNNNNDNIFDCIEKNIIGNYDKKENDNDDKDDNIIILDENNEEKSKDLPIDFKISLNLNQEDKNEKKSNNESKNKVNSTKELNRVKNKKDHLFINCNNIYKSNDHLPKIDINNLNSIRQSSIKDSPNNIFLRSNRKTLKPIQTKTISNSTDYKKYHKSNTIHILNDNTKQKQELNLMKKSLFYDKSNNNKKENNDEPIVINKNFKKMKSGLHPKNTYFKLSNKNNINDSFEEIKSKNDENEKNEVKSKSKLCKSKSKFINNLVGKETKIYVSNKRNQSTNNKKRDSKEYSNTNNMITGINNLKWKYN